MPPPVWLSKLNLPLCEEVLRSCLLGSLLLLDAQSDLVLLQCLLHLLHIRPGGLAWLQESHAETQGLVILRSHPPHPAHLLGVRSGTALGHLHRVGHGGHGLGRDVVVVMVLLPVCGSGRMLLPRALVEAEQHAHRGLLAWPHRHPWECRHRRCLLPRGNLSHGRRGGSAAGRR